jgi:hypothetical protein
LVLLPAISEVLVADDVDLTHEVQDLALLHVEAVFPECLAVDE